MGFLKKLFGTKELDAEARRRFLLESGRITDGVIIDSMTDADGNEVISYSYTLNGVDFESSDILTPEQRLDPIKYAPGAKVAVRFDPRNQGNCIVE
ncbi:MAG: hypothetical protein IPM50_05900 [Acidobacteriota bacterium]|nr:MAG: hypothetical protein IPM50_05900 [Acidobacteriota bacterium]